MKVSRVYPGRRYHTYLECRKVDDAVDFGVCCKDLVQACLVCDVDLVKVWSLPTEELDAVEGYL